MKKMQALVIFIVLVLQFMNTLSSDYVPPSIQHKDTLNSLLRSMFEHNSESKLPKISHKVVPNKIYSGTKHIKKQEYPTNPSLLISSMNKKPQSK